MDHETESKLLNNLEEYFSGRTVLFCTHRKSFIEKASRVIILDNKGIKNDVSSEEYLARLESFQNKQITG